MAPSATGVLPLLEHVSTGVLPLSERVSSMSLRRMGTDSRLRLQAGGGLSLNRSLKSLKDGLKESLNQSEVEDA